MPDGIIQSNANDAVIVYPRWLLSQHEVLQSISKNATSFASSVQMNISISIDIIGI